MKPRSARAALPHTPPGNLSFPIVGIGASAGGLEAFTELLKNLPATTGMAYVLVQHLDATHASLLVELLARTTPMDVHEAREGMKVEANHIYIIAPNTDLLLRQSKLKVVPQTTTAGQHLSIDTFLSSLAENTRHQAIGVILSGTASDGTRGLQAIKERGGITLAQDALSAQYPAMPRSAIAAGCVDFIGSTERIAQELIRISRHLSLSQTNRAEPEASDDGDAQDEHAFRQILHLLRRTTNVDFTAYKPTTLRRRIRRRMMLHQLTSFSTYLAYIHDHQTEVAVLHQDMLIGVTTFFRTPASYHALSREVFPRLLQTKTSQEQLRIWVPGCSTGEEVYSIAICVQEYLTQQDLSIPFHIFGTDLNGTAIAQARKGIYASGAVSGISPERLQSFFRTVHAGYQISASLRDHCIFAQQNLLSDPPFSHLALLSCQNVLIYLDPEAQQKIMRLFHYALSPHGFLLLGPSETIGTASDLFAPSEYYRHLYRQKNTSGRLLFMGESRTMTKKEAHATPKEEQTMRDEEGIGAFNIQKETDRLLLARYAPASVVIDAQMEILQFRGQTSPYLEPASGKASFNLFKMAREGLGLELRLAISKARKSGQPVKKTGIQLQNQGGHREIRVEVIPLQAATTEHFYLILFEDLPTASNSPDTLVQADVHQTEKAGRGVKDRRIRHLEQEVAATRQQMRSIVEEVEATNEELQSANEEILSSNEELRSLNEELETSQEEIQASNEELLIINQELQQSNAHLQTARDYTENIVKTLREPLLVLDADLYVQSVNPAFSEFFQVEPTQTVHHLLFEIGNHQWDIPALRTLLEQVLPEKQSFQDFEVDHFFPGIGHKILLLNARRIVGTPSRDPLILLAFEDVTERRELEWHKDAFLAIASHELKTPVTSLKAYAQLLRRQYTKASDEQAAHMLETMERQATKLAHLIGQLLDTSQLQQRTSPLQTRLFDVTELVQSIVQEVQQTTQKYQISLEGTIDEPFTGDPERISQVLTNVLSNAIKYSPQAGQIVVRLREDAGAVTLSVQDFGMGIPVDKQASLFERFYRVNDSAHTAIPGLGLGLYISAEIVKQHGGQMWVESREGKGATFFARFPSVRQHDPSSPPAKNETRQP